MMDRSSGVDAMKRFAPFVFVLLLTPPMTAYPPPAAQDPVAKLKQYDGLWADLAGDEAPATRALLKLSTKPDDAVALFAARLKPLKIEESKVRLLLADLGSDKDAVWKPAYATLQYFDPRLAIDLPTLMNDVTESPARWRLFCLLSGRGNVDKLPDEESVSLTDHKGEKGDVFYNFRVKNGSSWAEHRVDRLNSNYGTTLVHWTRAVRAISLLEHIGTPAAEAVLKDLATGHADAQPTKAAKEALKRLGKDK
jgi:hypothetical protein